MGMLMIARFNGTCSKCGAVVKKGAEEAPKPLVGSAASARKAQMVEMERLEKEVAAPAANLVPARAAAGTTAAAAAAPTMDPAVAAPAIPIRFYAPKWPMCKAIISAMGL